MLVNQTTQYRGTFDEKEFDRAGCYSGPQRLHVGAGGRRHRRLQRNDRKAEEGAYVSTVLFGDQAQVLHDRVKVGEVPLDLEDHQSRSVIASGNHPFVVSPFVHD